VLFHDADESIEAEHYQVDSNFYCQIVLINQGFKQKGIRTSAFSHSFFGVLFLEIKDSSGIQTVNFKQRICSTGGPSLGK